MKKAEARQIEDKMKKTLRPVSLVLSVILVVCAGIAIFEFTGAATDYRDGLKSERFAKSEPQEITSLLETLNLTEKGLKTLRAAAPALENSSVFNQDCSTHNPEIYVLGCYDSHKDRIFLYDITKEPSNGSHDQSSLSSSLSGIVESTAAHELLHAVWHRLPSWEKLALADKLTSFYKSLPEDAEIRNSMSLYTDAEFYDELHSRLGTEIADLPSSLEDHYGKYFNDQDSVVAFYALYSDNYKRLADELTALQEELISENDAIATETDYYYSWSEELNGKITNFNTLVNSFTYEQYQEKRFELEREIARFQAYYASLNDRVLAYNRKVADFNAKSENQRAILRSINSNYDSVEPTTITDALADPTVPLNNK